MATNRVLKQNGVRSFWNVGCVRHWIRGPEARACALSLAIHLVVIGSLSLAVFRINPGTPAFTVVSRNVSPAGEVAPIDAVLGPATSGVGSSVEFESLGTLAATATANWLAEAGSATGVGSVDPGGSSPVPLDSTIEVGRPSDLLQGIGQGQGDGIGNGKGSGRSMGNLAEGYSRPGGGRVVTKGRFTAWTVPADPGPRQSYLIVIQVEWPKTTDRRTLQARRFDLSGTILGTDSYFQSIEQTGIFVPKANQVVVPVPGGERNVRDVIRVHSKLLNESQELAILF